MSTGLAQHQLTRHEGSSVVIAACDAGSLLTVTAAGAGVFVFDTLKRVRGLLTSSSKICTWHHRQLKCR